MQTPVEIALMRAQEAERLYFELVKQHQELENTVVEMKQVISLLLMSMEVREDGFWDWLHSSYRIANWNIPYETLNAYVAELP